MKGNRKITAETRGGCGVQRLRILHNLKRTCSYTVHALHAKVLAHPTLPPIHTHWRTDQTQTLTCTFSPVIISHANILDVFKFSLLAQIDLLPVRFRPQKLGAPSFMSGKRLHWMHCLLAYAVFPCNLFCTVLSLEGTPKHTELTLRGWMNWWEGVSPMV